MKKILNILLILLMSFTSMAQVKTYSVEKELSDSLFKMINDYRVSKSLDTVEKSAKLRTYSKEHNTRLYITGTHSANDLYHSTGKKYNECVYFYKYDNFAASSEEDALSFVMSKNDIAYLILTGWIKSKGHDAILSLPNVTKGGVDVKIKIIKGKPTFPKGSNVYTVIFYGTYNVE